MQCTIATDVDGVPGSNGGQKLTDVNTVVVPVTAGHVLVDVRIDARHFGERAVGRATTELWILQRTKEYVVAKRTAQRVGWPMRRWWDEAGSGDGGGKVWVGCGWSLAVCGACGGGGAGG